MFLCDNYCHLDHAIPISLYRSDSVNEKHCPNRMPFDVPTLSGSRSLALEVAPVSYTHLPTAPHLFVWFGLALTYRHCLDRVRWRSKLHGTPRFAVRTDRAAPLCLVCFGFDVPTLSGSRSLALEVAQHGAVCRVPCAGVDATCGQPVYTSPTISPLFHLAVNLKIKERSY